jgi:dephospho-CoA kinase
VHRKASKKGRGRILDEMIAYDRDGLFDRARMPTGPPLTNPDEQVDRRKLRAKSYSDDTRSLLEYARTLLGIY